MKLDLRTRLFLASGLTIFAVIVQEPLVLGQLLALNVLLLIVLKISWSGPVRRLSKLWPVIIFLVFIGSIFQPAGKVLLELKGLPLLTSGGLEYGLAITLRLAVIMGSGLLFFSSGTRELVPAFSKLKIPYEITFMVQVGCRFLPLLAQEISNTLNALQLRGVDLKKVHLRKSVKICTFIFGPLLYSIWWRAQELAMVMEARGFKAYPVRTYYRKVEFQTVDYWMIGGFSFVLLSLAIINFR